MSKHTTHLCASAIRDALDTKTFHIGYRTVGPSRPAYLLNDLNKKESEKYRSRRNF